jgi:hypothetical protein
MLLKRTLILAIALTLLLPVMIPSMTHASKPEKVEAWIKGSEAQGTNRTDVLSLHDFRLYEKGVPRNLTPYSSKKLSECKALSFKHPFPKSLDKLTAKEKQLLLGILPKDTPESAKSFLNIFENSPLWLSLCCMAAEKSSSFQEKVELGVWSFDEKPFRYFFIESDPMGQRAFIRGVVSPVSGKRIKTDCSTFSPGNMYIRRLSREEIRALIKLDRNVDYWWRYSICMGYHLPSEEWGYATTLTGKKVDINDPLFDKPANEFSSYTSNPHPPPYILYVRLYGENGVLFEGLL